MSSKHAAQFLRFAWAEEPWTWRNGRAERRHDIELARKALVMGNLRLAASYRDGRISLLEKLTAGAVGLVNGVDGLDQDQASLGTYGALWVRAKVLRLSHTYGDGARRSSLQLEYRFKLRRWLRDQRAEGCAPDFAALCRAFPELGQDMVWMSLVEVSDRSPRLSRTSPLPEDDDALVRARTATWKEITADWEKLQERERRVLHDRVGLSGSVQTLTEIGKHFNLSRERIRQLEMSGWLRLRPPESPAAVEFWRHLASNPEKRTSMLASLHVKLPAPPSLLVTMVSKLGVSTLAEARAVPKDALRALPCAGKGKRQAWVRWLNQVERDALVAAFAQVGGAVDCIRPKLVKSP
ncbi:MAG: hypothetical protein JXX28_05760 [Deltaproteobacteria bacterium]|nr:hypothetical protein [Deltaproteobacteria bacterium]